MTTRNPLKVTTVLLCPSHARRSGERFHLLKRHSPWPSGKSLQLFSTAGSFPLSISGPFFSFPASLFPLLGGSEPQVHVIFFSGFSSGDQRKTLRVDLPTCRCSSFSCSVHLLPLPVSRLFPSGSVRTAVLLLPFEVSFVPRFDRAGPVSTAIEASFFSRRWLDSPVAGVLLAPRRWPVRYASFHEPARPLPLLFSPFLVYRKGVCSHVLGVMAVSPC